jgi:Ribosomal protein L11 methyltransferase (PrmA)
MVLKSFLRRSLPGPYQSVQELLAERRLRRVGKVLEQEHGLVIQGGPFAGMAYVSEAVCSSLVPKLLGSYEAELQHVFAEVIDREYETVIDVGCAEGYYAVGLALRLPSARVHAFDIDPRARELCARLAQVNNVSERVLIHELCDHEQLNQLIQGRTLIVCDCEGCELQLLDPERAPTLNKSDLVVELHDMMDSRITPTILSRFESTHKITLVDAVDRDPNAFPALSQFDRLTQRTAVAEFRDSPMQWAYMLATDS